MKKRLLVLLLCLVLLAGTVRAAEAPRVVDEADILSAGEEARLESEILRLREAYGMDVVILTVWSLDGRSPRNYADDYYDYNGYGDGADDSGMLFLLALESRDWYISTYGRAVDVMTDYGVAQSAEAALPYLSDGDYADGFEAWLEVLPDYFESWQAGKPVDVPGVYEDEGINWLLCGLMGLFFGGVGVVVLLAMHRTKVPQAGAGSYLGSFRLHNQKDLFLSSHVSKTRRSESTSSGGSRGGSSTHRSSSGRSHGGGGGKF